MKKTIILTAAMVILVFILMAGLGAKPVQTSTCYLSIPGAAFINESPANPGINEGTGAFVYMADGVSMYAPVYLPHNAIVTDFKGFFSDGWTSSVSVSLNKYELLSGFTSIVTTMATASSETIDPNVGYGSVHTSTITDPQINNMNNGYYLKAQWNETNVQYKVKGAVITYTINIP